MTPSSFVRQVESIHQEIASIGSVADLWLQRTQKLKRGIPASTSTVCTSEISSCRNVENATNPSKDRPCVKTEILPHKPVVEKCFVTQCDKTVSVSENVPLDHLAPKASSWFQAKLISDVIPSTATPGNKECQRAASTTETTSKQVILQAAKPALFSSGKICSRNKMSTQVEGAAKNSTSTQVESTAQNNTSAQVEGTAQNNKSSQQVKGTRQNGTSMQIQGTTHNTKDVCTSVNKPSNSDKTTQLNCTKPKVNSSVNIGNSGETKNPKSLQTELCRADILRPYNVCLHRYAFKRKWITQWTTLEKVVTLSDPVALDRLEILQCIGFPILGGRLQPDETLSRHLLAVFTQYLQEYSLTAAAEAPSPHQTSPLKLQTWVNMSADRVIRLNTIPEELIPNLDMNMIIMTQFGMECKVTLANGEKVDCSLPAPKGLHLIPRLLQRSSQAEEDYKMILANLCTLFSISTTPEKHKENQKRIVAMIPMICSRMSYAITKLDWQGQVVFLNLPARFFSGSEGIAFRDGCVTQKDIEIQKLLYDLVKLHIVISYKDLWGGRLIDPQTHPSLSKLFIRAIAIIRKESKPVTFESIWEHSSASFTNAFCMDFCHGFRRSCRYQLIRNGLKYCKDATFSMEYLYNRQKELRISAELDSSEDSETGILNDFWSEDQVLSLEDTAAELNKCLCPLTEDIGVASSCKTSMDAPSVTSETSEPKKVVEAKPKTRNTARKAITLQQSNPSISQDSNPVTETTKNQSNNRHKVRSEEPIVDSTKLPSPAKPSIMEEAAPQYKMLAEDGAEKKSTANANKVDDSGSLECQKSIRTPPRKKIEQGGVVNKRKPKTSVKASSIKSKFVLALEAQKKQYTPTKQGQSKLPKPTSSNKMSPANFKQKTPGKTDHDELHRNGSGDARQKRQKGSDENTTPYIGDMEGGEQGWKGYVKSIQEDGDGSRNNPRPGAACKRLFVDSDLLITIENNSNDEDTSTSNLADDIIKAEDEEKHTTELSPNLESNSPKLKPKIFRITAPKTPPQRKTSPVMNQPTVEKTNPSDKAQGALTGPFVPLFSYSQIVSGGKVPALPEAYTARNQLEVCKKPIDTLLGFPELQSTQVTSPKYKEGFSKQKRPDKWTSNTFDMQDSSSCNVDAFEIAEQTQSISSSTQLQRLFQQLNAKEDHLIELFQTEIPQVVKAKPNIFGYKFSDQAKCRNENITSTESLASDSSISNSTMDESSEKFCDKEENNTPSGPVKLNHEEIGEFCPLLANMCADINTTADPDIETLIVSPPAAYDFHTPSHHTNVLPSSEKEFIPSHEHMLGRDLFLDAVGEELGSRPMESCSRSENPTSVPQLNLKPLEDKQTDSASTQPSCVIDNCSPERISHRSDISIDKHSRISELDDATELQNMWDHHIRNTSATDPLQMFINLQYAAAGLSGKTAPPAAFDLVSPSEALKRRQQNSTMVKSMYINSSFNNRFKQNLHDTEMQLKEDSSVTNEELQNQYSEAFKGISETNRRQIGDYLYAESAALRLGNRYIFSHRLCAINFGILSPIQVQRLWSFCTSRY